MTTLSKWQRKLVLLVKSERRLNAGKIIKTFNDKSFDEMKSTIITESMCNLETLTDKRKTKDLECHLNNLKYQMRGHSELYYVVTLINTLRAYETKNFLQLPNQVKCIPLVDDKVTMLYQGDLPLYDDLTYFRIGGDDSLKNMRRRYEKFYEVDYLANTILLFVFDKLQTHDNAFYTLRLLHKDERSRWWLD